MRILVVSPHPDDETFGCGGTLAAARAAGANVLVVFLTAGEGGGHGRSPEETARIRRAEAERALDVLGGADAAWWDEPDGGLQVTDALVHRLATLIDDWKPDRILCPHPDEDHPDHRAAAELTTLAAGAAATAVDVLAYEVWTPLQQLDELTDITETLPVKLAAIEQFESQQSAVDFASAMRGLAAYRGALHLWPGGPHAEAFRRLR